jgi:hypothetical protein
MAAVSRYIIKRGNTQVHIALQAMIEICRSKGIGRVTLVVPHKGRFVGTIFAQAIGSAAAKALAKGQIVTLADGVTMNLESAQTYRPSAGHGLLVGVHIDDKSMNRLDDSWSAQAIMYLPWNDQEDQEWRATWKPTEIGYSSEASVTSSLSDGVVEALKLLTRNINLGTGLGHPSDEALAKRVFAKLRSEGHSFDPAEVRRWAQRNNWSSSAAADLEKIARKRR